MFHLTKHRHRPTMIYLVTDLKFSCLVLTLLLGFSTPVFALSLSGWEPNAGQWPTDWAYRTTTSSGASTINAEGKLIHQVARTESQVTEVFVGARTNAWQGVAAQSTKASYFRGADSARWRTGLPRFGGLRMDNAYPGIDILLQLNGSELERLFELAPNADSALIQLSLGGAKRAQIDVDGRLQLSFSGTETRFEYSAPVAWQNTEQGRAAVQVSWLKLGPQQFGFNLGPYNKHLPLTIDPVSRTTYFGGSAADSGSGSLAHSNGDLYLLTSTTSTDLAGTTGGTQAASSGGQEIAVARLSADLTALKQVTYYGGSADEVVQSLNELENGDLLIVGNTSSADLPGTSGGAQAAFAGNSPFNAGLAQGDGFAVRLSADLSTIVQATYLGGSTTDVISAVAMDGDTLYLLGTTDSIDFPGVTGGAQTTGDQFPAPSDLFVTRMPLTLTSITQSTFYGGDGLDQAFSLLVNGNGVYVAGTTSSTDLTGSSGGAQSAFASAGDGTSDAFVVRFNAGLTVVDQATYFGGSGQELVATLTELGGALYLAGGTASADLPNVAGGAQSTFNGGVVDEGGIDAFVALVSADLSSITQATYFGGSGVEFALSPSSNGGNLYLSGGTNSTDLPGTNGAAQPNFAGGGAVGDGFVASLSSDLTTLIRTTYIGGSGDELGFAVFDQNGALYFSGATNSPDMPAVTGGLQETFGGAGAENLGDVYIALLSADLTTIQQGSYFGGNGDDNGGLILNANGEVAYIAGTTTSTDLPATAGAVQPAHADPASEDLFIAAINGELTGSTGGADPDPSGPIVSAALPGQRVFTLGGPGVTFFGTVINAGSTTAVDCSLALGTAIPAAFSYQTTSSSNELIGTANTPVDIAAGAAQSFLFSITPTATFASTVVMPVYDCANTDPAPVSPGVNTVQVLSTDVATPDVVAIVLSATNDGIAHIPGTTGSVAVAMATVNVGASADVTLSADTGALDLGVTISICQTNPADGSCFAAPTATVTPTIASNATPTFSVFITGSQDIPNDPANNRINLRFMQGGTQVGQSSLALQTD